jgi:hypothetical protein
MKTELVDTSETNSTWMRCSSLTFAVSSMSSRRVTLLVYPTTPQSRRFCVESMDALCSLSRRNSSRTAAARTRQQVISTLTHKYAYSPLGAHATPSSGTSNSCGHERGRGRGRAQSMSLSCYPSFICVDPCAVPIFNCCAIRSPPRVVFQSHAIAHPHEATAAIACAISM